MRTKGSKNKEWSPRGNGKLIDDNFLVQEYVMYKKNPSMIARENGWCPQTVKLRLIRLGVYKTKAERNGEVYQRFGMVEAVRPVQQTQVNSPMNVPTPQPVQQSVNFEELSDEEKRARREESKRRYEEMRRNGQV